MALNVDWKQPVPEPYVPLLVYVKLVASAISTFTAAAVVVAKIIFAVPNVIERAVVPEETKVPVVKVNPPKFKLPEVSVVVPVAVNVNAAVSVVVPPLLLITRPSNDDDPPPLILPAEPTILTVNVVYEPPLANVKLP